MRKQAYRYKDDLSLEPLAKDVDRYSLKKLRGDISAALSVALLSVPQALAFSVVAGVPPVAGLISMVLGTMIAALLSSSSHLVIGPNNATSLLVQAASIEVVQKFYGATGSIATVELIGLLTLLIGSFQLMAAFFKLGRLIQFVSYSVVVGYIAGTAFCIGIGQLFAMTGISCPPTIDTLYQKIFYWVFHLKETHLITASIGIASLALCFMLRRFSWKVPSALTMLVLMSGITFLFGLNSFQDGGGHSLQLLACGNLRDFSFSFDTPLFDFRLLNFLVPISFAIALIGMLEANAIAKGIAVTTGQRLTANQEIFALGSANFFLAFVGGLPCSGSASRSAMNVESGAKTRFASILGALFVAFFAFALAPLLQYVPKASLAALLLATACRLVDIRQLRFCWSSTRSDAFVLLTTFLSCVFFSLPLALYIGVMLSIILYLRKAAIPHVSEYIYEEKINKFRPATEKEREGKRAIRVINAEGELFFGSMDLFQYALRAMAKNDRSTRVIILRLKHVRDLDATAALALKQLKDYLQRHNQYLIVCSVPKHVYNLLEKSRLTTYLGKENIIPCDNRSLHGDLTTAFARARDLVPETGSGVACEMGTVPVIQPSFVTIKIPESAISSKVVE